MTCNVCGEPIDPEEPDIRYRPGDGESRMDYHSTCWHDAVLHEHQVEDLLRKWAGNKSAWEMRDKDGARAFEYCRNDLMEMMYD